MSAYPDSEIVVPMARPKGLTPVQFAALGTVFAALGVATVWPTAQALWKMWLAEPTKSIGMAIPVVSLVLILRAWRALGWRAEGSWWGLAVLLATMAAVWTQQRAVLILVVTPHWSTVLPPASLVAVGYAAGAVLLLGGTRLFRAALFPILLLWFVNPVPHAFSLLVDLPLQTVSAHMARAFAIALGQHLTPDKLRLMFTPDFGMFIAPGCNGIRGSVTMGFIALIAGYVYRFRWYANALVVMGAILLGYAFNLARLCLLVFYYVVALHFTSLQNKAEGADYLIGAALFLVATLLLFAVIHRLRDAGELNASDEAAVPQDSGIQSRASGGRYAQLAAMGAIALVACAGVARAGATTRPSAINAGDAIAGRFPARIGSYMLVRSWNETLLSGAVIYMWGQYAPAGGGTPIAIGVSPVLLHDPLLCHTVRGDSPLWQGPLTFSDADAVPTKFNSALYSDGVTEYLEASTQCSGTSCGEFATERTHFGFVYSQPDPETLLSGNPRPPIPVLVRAETLDSAMPPDAARQQLTGDLRAFLASVRLEDLTRPYLR
jgi:exosortase J